MTRWAQLWCLWKIHRSWRPRQWFLGLFEILLPAIIIWASLVYSGLQRRHLRRSPNRLPLFNGWPEYDVSHTLNEGVEVLDLADSKEYQSDEIIWLAGTEGCPEEYVNKTVDKLHNLSGSVKIKVWENPNDMLQYLTNPVNVLDWDNWRKWFGVVGSAKAAVLINETDYVIFAPDFKATDTYGTISTWDQSSAARIYWKSDLLSFQIALEKSLFYASSDLDTTLKINVTRYDPQHQMTLDRIVRSMVLISHLAPNLGLVGCLSFLIPFVRMVNSLVRHKQSGTIHFLAINGMSRSLYYTAFMLTALLPRLVIYVPILTFTVQWGVLPDVHAGYIFCLISLFLVSLIPFAALMAEFCSSPLLSLVISSSFYILCSIFGLVASACSDSILLTSGVCFQHWQGPSIFPPAAFSVGLATMSQMQLKDYNYGQHKHDYPDLGRVYLIFFIDILLYSLLTCAVKEHAKILKFFRSRFFYESERHRQEYITPAAISVQDANVSLNGKEILKNVSLSVDFAEKTALLGHNGAGKTTLLKVVTGILPTTGTVLLNGVEVCVATRNGWVGYCPQEDVLKLIPDMTVKEVLELIACIKGIPIRELPAYAESAAASIGLHDKRHELPRVLALGQRRKLAVSMAFMGNPKLVILDEPTAGLDPRSRRQVWDLIKKSKHSSCLYTTHLLEEARLGDKLAILNRGELPDDRIGSLTSLKEKLGGVFQQLTIVKGDSSAALNQSIIEALNFHELEWSTSGRTLTVQLEGDLQDYAGVLRMLQDVEQSNSLGIESFSLKMTGLEEFVVRLCDPIVSGKKSGTTASTASGETTPLLSNSISEPETQESLPTLLRVRSTFLSIPMQIITILVDLKIHSTFRSMRFLAFQMLVPLLFIFFSLFITDGLLQDDLTYIKLSSNMTTVADRIPMYVNTETAIGERFLGLLQSVPPDLPMYPDGLNGGFENLYSMSSPVALNVTSIDERLLGLNVWFNVSATHTLPVVANYLMNVVRENSSYHRMNGHLQSYPVNSPWVAPLVVYGTFFGCSLALVTSLFAGKLVNERTNGARYLTQLSGVHDTTFYVAYGLADLIASYVVEVALLGVTCIWYPSTNATFGAVALLLLLFTPCILAMNYSMSYAFKSGLHGAMWCTFYHVVVVHAGLIFCSTLSSHQAIIRRVWHWLSPLFVVVDGFLYFQNFLEIAATDIREQKTSSSPEVTLEGHYFILMWQLLIWSVALTLCESGYKIKNLIKKLFPRPAGYYEREAALAGVEQDQSIRNEMKDVEKRMGLNHTDLFMKQVRKVYGKNVAVSGMYLRLKPGDCFGMLSPSGAGKTTALLMMAGLLSPTQGEVMVRGLSNLYPLELKRLQKLMGYLPQTDPLPADLTVHQVILFYAKLKGIGKADDSLVDELLEKIGLLPMAKKQCGSLSGGAKRLVALAIALLGAPPILLLDEPTTAMDTVTRKKAWWMINSRARTHNDKSDTITVLATHSMTEADSVCNRIGVLLHGHMSTIGSPLELKERFASGYYLQISLESDANQPGNRRSTLNPLLSKNDLIGEIMHLFPGAKLIEAHHNTNEFHLPSGTSLAEVVEWAGRRKIVDYSLSQMSFEHAYLRTVEQQRTLQSAKDSNTASVPPLKISILIVGSRGDVQPFIALAQGLLKAGHTVQIATHGCFKNFVMSHFVSMPGRVFFYDIGGDPETLMKFMVEHPSMISVNLQELRAKRKMMLQIFRGCWAAVTNGFQPEVLIANPPTQVHVHIAEALHIPLQIHFTMPWSPTKTYLHPLAVVSAFGNEQSYGIVEDLMWLGLSDIINTLRSEMGLPTMSQGSGLQHTLQVPHVYCVSEVLVPKPVDWGPHITVSGFWFLDGNVKGYTPPDDLAEFLSEGSPPIYIGFGSIVTPPNSSLEQIVIQSLDALHSEDGSIRAIISPGWAKLGLSLSVVPDYIFIADQPVPHDWLFPKCSIVVHHGGAGTTAAGLRAGVPTVVIPFFGDQPFWGQCIHRQGVGSAPIPIKNLTQRALVAAIRQCREPEMLVRVKDLQEIIISEAGVQTGVNAFHNYLPLDPGGGWIVGCVENQRWFPVIGWSATLSFGDPSPFSDETGLLTCAREEYVCPEGWFWEDDWEVRKHVDSTDADGFEYASSFKGPTWKRFPGRGDVVRRRRWFRRRVRTGVKTSTSDAAEIERLRHENKLLRSKVSSQATSIRTLLASRDRPDMALTVGEVEPLQTFEPEEQFTVAAAVGSGCVSIARVMSEHFPVPDASSQTIADIANELREEEGGGSPIEMATRTDLSAEVFYESDTPYVPLAS